MDKFGVYIHIPFCKKKCNYCDFISFSNAENKIKKYFNILTKEIMNSKINKKVTTIYIGGGTPSYVDSKYIKSLMNVIYNKFEIEENAEITIEVNPGTITKEKVLDYKKSGINRISIGLQSANNKILNLIGRIHTYEEFLETYNVIKEAGFSNINVDLMLALPTQTKDDLIDSVNKVIDLKPKHISIYSLILENETKLQELVENKQIELPDENIEREMYWVTKKILEKNGYNHYEISNFAKKGYESKHNLDCWNQEEYIGFGLSAHSYINKKRLCRPERLSEYLENEDDIIINEVQTKELQMKEYMLLGLRKIEGVSISKFEQKFRINPLFYFRFEINKLVDEKLIEVDLDKIKLTSKGLDLANLVFEEFV